MNGLLQSFPGVVSMLVGDPLNFAADKVDEGIEV